MKVLFLDFDGVLNSWQEAHYHHRLSKTPLLRFRSFLYWLYYKGDKLYPKKIKRWLRWEMFFWLSNHCDFCPIACNNLQLLLEVEPELRIVVSSTWRLNGMKIVRRVLKRNGIDVSRFIGITGTEGSVADGRNSTHLDGAPRGEEIQRWLYDNQDKNVTHIVIVDDDSDMAHLKEFHVKTSTEEGFMFKKMERAKEILQVPYKLGMKFDPENPIV